MKAGDLERFYDVPSAVTVLLVGGPFDGEERQFSAALLKLQVVARLECVMPQLGLQLGSEPGPPKALPRATYQALRDEFGFFSRDDQGRVRFDFWGLR